MVVHWQLVSFWEVSLPPEYVVNETTDVLVTEAGFFPAALAICGDW